MRIVPEEQQYEDVFWINDRVFFYCFSSLVRFKQMLMTPYSVERDHWWSKPLTLFRFITHLHWVVLINHLLKLWYSYICSLFLMPQEEWKWRMYFRVLILSSSTAKTFQELLDMPWVRALFPVVITLRQGKSNSGPSAMDWIVMKVQVPASKGTYS